jgi:RND family efflux transporter MFP subunit
MKCFLATGRPGSARRVIIAVFSTLLVAAVLSLAGCGEDDRPEQQVPGAAAAEEVTDTPVPVSTAVRTDLDETLEITGTAEANDEVDVVAEVSGKVSRVYADVGDYVNRGSTLVRVDTEVAAAQRDQASASVQSARAAFRQAQEALQLTEDTTASNVRQAEVGVATARERLQQAKASLRLTEAQVNNAVEQAQTGVRTAQTRLEEVRSGARQQERRQAEARVRQAKASLQLAEQTYNRHQRLFEGGVIAEQRLDQVQTEYEVAQENYQQALEQLSLVEEGPRSEQVRLAELAVDQAKEQLAQAKANCIQIEVAEQDVQAARDGVRQAEEQLTAAIANRGQVEVQQRQVASARAGIDQAQASERVAAVQLNKHAVHSPIAGLVAARMVDTGEGAMPGTPVMRIVDIDPIRIDAIVNQVDIGRVRDGIPALVRFDGLAGRDFEGAVTDIEPQAIPESRNYIVRINVPNPDGVVKPGMFARVSLLLGSQQDVVVIQRDALLERDHVREVYIVRDGVVQVRQVEVGVVSGNLVEIVDGVREGETVIVSGQDTVAEGEQVEPVPATAPDTEA